MLQWATQSQGCLNALAVPRGPMIILDYIILVNCPEFAGIVRLSIKLSLGGCVIGSILEPVLCPLDPSIVPFCFLPSTVPFVLISL